MTECNLSRPDPCSVDLGRETPRFWFEVCRGFLCGFFVPRKKARTRRIGANPEKSDLVNFRGSDWRKFSELCVLLFFPWKTDKMLPKSWFSKPIFGHSAGSTKLDRPYCKRFWKGPKKKSTKKSTAKIAQDFARKNSPQISAEALSWQLVKGRSQSCSEKKVLMFEGHGVVKLQGDNTDPCPEGNSITHWLLHQSACPKLHISNRHLRERRKDINLKFWAG